MCELCPLVLEFEPQTVHKNLPLLCGMNDGQIIIKNKQLGRDCMIWFPYIPMSDSYSVHKRSFNMFDATLKWFVALSNILPRNNGLYISLLISAALYWPHPHNDFSILFFSYTNV